MDRTFDQWLAAVLPDPVRVAGVPLHPLSIGHVLVLSRLTGWEPLVTPFQWDNLPVGLWVCSRTWREAALRVGSWRARRFLRLAGETARREGLESVGEQFATYLSRSLVIPKTKRRPLPGPTAATAPPMSPGTPFLLRLRLFAADRLGTFNWEDMSAAEVVWLYAAHMENEGAVRVLTDAEIESDDDFDAWCREQDKLAEQKARN